MLVDRALEIRVHVLHAAAPDLLATLRLIANGRPLPVQRARTEVGTIMLSASMPPPGESPPRAHLRVTLEIPRTVRPCDLGVKRRPTLAGRGGQLGRGGAAACGPRVTGWAGG